jgi:outer membrane lipoprotein SlyB
MSEENKNENVVIGFFATDDIAKEAIDGLKQWDKINYHIDLGEIGTITKEGDKIRTHVHGHAGAGAVVGATLGVIGTVLTGGLGLIGAAALGGGAGAALGHFFKKSLHLTPEEIEQIGKRIDGGEVAVVVNCDEDEIDEVTEYLTASQGSVQTYRVPSDALADAAEAVSADVTRD